MPRQKKSPGSSVKREFTDDRKLAAVVNLSKRMGGLAELKRIVALIERVQKLNG